MTRTTLRTHEIGMIEREEFKVVFSGCRVVVCVKSENKKFEGYHGTTTLRFITYRLVFASVVHVMKKQNQQHLLT